jgi:lysophospholipase L1-like esterase
LRRAVLAAWAAAGLLLVSACATPTAGSDPSPASSPHDPGSPTVVGLGDSVMGGTNCGCSGIMSLYAEQEHAASPSTRIVPVNLGVPGATTSTLRSDLQSSSVLSQVARARVVVVIIGANDLIPQLRRWQRSGCSESCYAPAVTAMGERLHSVLGSVAAARRSSTGAVLVLDYWNVFRDGEQTRQSQGQEIIDWARTVSRLANSTICRASRDFHDTCVDLYGPMLGTDDDPSDLLAADGDHPNAKGVDLIVDRLVAATPRAVFGG